ncbi:MAG: hypothetical protein QOG77_3391 [Solirubrobacteraceae bacterium]|nr:hypothetical protein [Solirubrobacteraceae bacterium]
MSHAIDWSAADVQEGRLSVPIRPDPDFAFLKVFDMVLIESPPPPGAAAWGEVQFAGGQIVVSEVQPGSAPALERFLDGVVREADRRAGAERESLERQADRERQAAEDERREADAASSAAERRDDRLEDEFRQRE